MAIAAVLAEYTPDVVRRVTDPRTGLPSYSKFLPTVSEVRAACQEIVDGREQSQKRAADLENQFAERERYEKARERAPTRAELEARGVVRKPECHPLPADKLAAKMRAARAQYGDAVQPSEETRQILVAAGYDLKTFNLRAIKSNTAA